MAREGQAADIEARNVGRRRRTTMTARTGGTQAKAGFYWNLRTWAITTLSGEGGTLPGGEGDRYLRLPTLAMLVLAPVMGGLFVVFLPFIGFAVLFTHLARKGTRSAARLARAALGRRAAVPPAVHRHQPRTSGGAQDGKEDGRRHVA
jgi:hypothetical protein